MKVVIADVKSGKCYQREVAKEQEGQLVGRKVRDTFDGGIVGLPGFKLAITGGSDVAGVPMRKDVAGSRRVKAFLSGGTGVRGLRKGGRKVKLVAGNTVSAQVAQLNAKIVEYGAKALEELGFVLTSKEKKVEGDKAAGEKAAGAKK